MNTKIKKIIFRICGSNYEQEAGPQVGPNSVGTEEIQDHGVKEEDLDEEIVNKLDALDDSNVITEEEIDEIWEEALHRAMGDGT